MEDYIRTAQPVASSRVRNEYRFTISAATIRNTMAMLEESGFLMHPHTSAGKVPTDKGYRTYVNQLMVVDRLSDDLVREVRQNLEELSGDLDALLQMVSHIISRLSGGLGITITPVNLGRRLRAIRLLSVSPQRILLALELDSGAVRTIVAEGAAPVRQSQLVMLEEILNERLSGLTLEEIRATIGDRLEGTLAADLGITALILNNSDELLSHAHQGNIHIHGLQQVLMGPEFFEQSNVVTLVSLVEDEGRLRELVQGRVTGGEVGATIGDEHGDEDLATFATISCSFDQGPSSGTLAVLSPKRVNYSQVFAVLEFVSHTLTELIMRQD